MGSYMDNSGKVPRIVFAVLRYLAAAAAGFLLYTFLYTISLNQINQGDVLGSIYCVIVILLALFYPLLRKKRPLRIASIVLGACLAAFAVYCAVISGFIASEIIKSDSTTAAPDDSPHTVIILGCKTFDGVPSTMLELRLVRGIEYLNCHPGAVCIVTGGQGADEIEPEAVSMHRYLIEHGIADERIYVEPESVNTEQNIRHSSEIISRENLPTDIVIVSECYHIYRGVRQARLAGFNASGIYPDPSPVLITMPTYWLREIFAVSRDFVVGMFS